MKTRRERYKSTMRALRHTLHQGSLERDWLEDVEKYVADLEYFSKCNFEHLVEEQAVLLQKRQTEIDNLKEELDWQKSVKEALRNKLESSQHWIDHYKSAIPKGENKIIEQNKMMKKALELIKKRNSEFEKHNNTWKIANEALKTIERLNNENK